MPDAANPVAIAWVEKLAEVVGAPSIDTYLVGHSLGCITILRYLETLQKDERVGGVVMVAGFGQVFDGYHGQHDTFFDHELDWQKIRVHCRQFVAIHSDNDPSIKLNQMELFERELGAKGLAVSGLGHFGSADNVFKLPVVRDELISLADRQLPSKSS
jgi:predicted alpha/beta hydrolase family esterase